MVFSRSYETFEDWLKVSGRLRPAYRFRIIRGHARYPEASLKDLGGHPVKYYYCYLVGWETRTERQGDISFECWLEFVALKNQFITDIMIRDIYKNEEFMAIVYNDIIVRWMSERVIRANILKMGFERRISVERKTTNRRAGFPLADITLYRVLWKGMLEAGKRLEEGYEVVDGEEIDVYDYLEG